VVESVQDNTFWRDGNDVRALLTRKRNGRSTSSSKKKRTIARIERPYGEYGTTAFRGWGKLSVSRDILSSVRSDAVVNVAFPRSKGVLGVDICRFYGEFSFVGLMCSLVELFRVFLSRLFTYGECTALLPTTDGHMNVTPERSSMFLLHNHHTNYTTCCRSCRIF